ncbi:DUF4179 domain-containing protein [Schleiferilactobacillus perolens]|uniref:DUF4179 domain-containing protein n=1 Tax=Schleiferilactobacillus perolens DSM 12744 TaxID=1423792 RepID=A0A0R1N4F9_9LACO|nr:DUF4179 domain-containing protein [Schleiferilactobacillus perolens]KRL12434.1 hypothetical protein FD09_GL003017 [Schleiferilactobacillus perolens DSM 12744]
MTKLDQLLQNLTEREPSPASNQAMHRALAQIHDTPQLPPLPVKRSWRWLPKTIVLALIAAFAIGFGWQHFSPTQSNIDQVPNNFDNSTFTPPSATGQNFAAPQTSQSSGITLTMKQVYADRNGYGFTLTFPEDLVGTKKKDQVEPFVDLVWQTGQTLTSPGFLSDRDVAGDQAWVQQNNIAAVFKEDNSALDKLALMSDTRHGGELFVNVIQENLPLTTPSKVYIRRLYLGGKTYTGNWQFQVSPIGDSPRTLNGQTNDIKASLITTRAGSVLTIQWPKRLYKDKALATSLIINGHQIDESREGNEVTGDTVISKFPFSVTQEAVKGTVQVQFGDKTVTLQ